MKLVNFGRSGLKVTEYCLGCLTMGSLQSNLSTEVGASIITTAVENGINFIDTAEIYGNDAQINLALDILRKKSPELLENLVIATKTKAQTADEMDDFVERTRKNFNKESLDIVCLHNIADENAFLEREAAYTRALELKDEGMISEIGWTAHSFEGLKPVLDHADGVSVIMPIINFKGFGLRGYTQDDLLNLLKEAKNKQIYVYSMKSLGGGHLRESIEEAIKWLRENPLVDVAAVGAKSPAEVLMNIYLFNDEPVPAEIREKIENVPRHIIIYHNLCQKCGKCAEACTSGAMSFSEKEGPVIDHESCVICGYCAEACPKFIIRVV
ncbi:MAG: aldo/keto reductase [Candidatus Hodarchaeota archaeon]